MCLEELLDAFYGEREVQKFDNVNIILWLTFNDLGIVLNKVTLVGVHI